MAVVKPLNNNSESSSKLSSGLVEGEIISDIIRKNSITRDIFTEKTLLRVDTYNRFSAGDMLNAILPGLKNRDIHITGIFDQFFC